MVTTQLSQHQSHYLPHPSKFVPQQQQHAASPVLLHPQQQQALVQALAIQQLYKQLQALPAQQDSFTAAIQTEQKNKSKAVKQPSQTYRLKQFLANSLKVLALLALLTAVAGSARRLVTRFHPQQVLKTQELEDFKLLNHYLDAKILHHLPKPIASGLAAFLSPFKAFLPGT